MGRKRSSMKKALLLSCLLFVISFSAFSQVTYLADTAFTTDAGYNGASASCIFTGGDVAGWRMQRNVDQWLADVFTVPAGATWTFDTVIVYGYQKGSTTTSPFLNCNLQIYNGTPGLGGSVIWGDTVTNVLVSTDFTGIYRVDTFASDGGLADISRPIMYLKLYLSAPPHLSSGTYWLSWSVAGNTTTADSPPKVLSGRINPPSQMARQFSGSSWNYAVDGTNNVGFNKIIKASAAVSSVPGLTSNLSATLNQNTPNPFNHSTNISFNTPTSGYAHLSVYNTIGQRVATLIDGDINAGNHIATFNADNLPAGVYYYQLNTNAGIESKQMLLIK